MSRWRTIAGLIAGLLLILSSAAHSLLGWKVQRTGLEAARAPADLILGLGLGWHFAGVAMLAFGVIAIMLTVAAGRGRPVSLRPLLVIGVAYAGYGIWAMIASGLEPFFLVFILPGVLLLAVAWGRA